MKRIITTLFLLFVCACVWAQAPQKMSYQAVVRNSNNSLVTNQNVTARISILQGGAAGSAVYVETQAVPTNANGLMTVTIGEGAVLSGSFGAIDWANGPYFLKSEIDPNGGVNYSMESVQQLMSVPYALYAATSGNGEGPQGPVGPQGPQGDTGATGPQGPAGQDGVSPTVATTTTPTGTFVVITDATGSHQFFVANGTDGATGAQGPQGIQGATGPQGPAGADGTNGTNGTDGRGILNIIGPVSNGLIDTYTITYTDGTTSTFTVTNGAAGVQGPAGPQGVQGATGATGPQGPAGTNGRGILNIVGPVTNGLADTYTITYTDGTTSTFTVTNGAAGAQGSQGPQGEQGLQGATGPQGPAGANGADGRGIQSISGPVTAGLTDTYTINYTDGTTSTFTVTNGAAGTQGPAGPQGVQGEAGATGATGPQGPAGANGTNGADGRGIANITGPVSAGNVDTYTINYTDGTTSTFTVTNGLDGAAAAAGIGIDSIAKTGTNGLVDTYTITYTDGTTTTYTVTNGAAGAQGPAGPQGPAGANGTNGISPTVTAAAVGSNVIITVTDGTGTHTYTIPTSSGEITQQPADWNATSGVTQILNKPNLATVATTGNYNDLTDTPTIPTIPTNLSAFNNDAGYLTGYTETQTLAQVTANGNSAGNRQLKNVSDPTDNLDAVNLRTLTMMMDTMMSRYQQLQQQIDSLRDVIDALLNNNSNENVFICGISTMTDIDGNIYNTVKIGDQCWMRENLRTTHYGNGDVISLGSVTSDSDPYYYNDTTSTIALKQRGYLYNWAAVMHDDSSSNAVPSGVQGICPDGWHVPSRAECEQLLNYIRSQSQYMCGNSIAKALASQTGWNDGYSNSCSPSFDPSVNNASGFSAFPIGSWNNGVSNAGGIAFFWTSTSHSTNSAMAYGLNVAFTTAANSNGTAVKSYGCSVRCVSNCVSSEGADSIRAILPTITTDSLFIESNTTAVCISNVVADGGATLTARGVCWSTSPDPTVSDSHTVESGGTGRFTSRILGWTTGAKYYVRAYATNSAGTAYGNELTIVIPSNPIPEGDAQPCPGIPTVTDIEGNVYNTVKIGDQCWLKENMRSLHYSNGDSIPVGYEVNYTGSYYSNYSNSGFTLEQRGYLYSWQAAMHGANSSNAIPSGVQGICPTGWHVPSDGEWRQLFNYVGDQNLYLCAGAYMIAKALSSDTGWHSNLSLCTPGNNQSSNNATGFSAIPSGVRDGGYNGAGHYTRFWSSSKIGSYDLEESSVYIGSHTVSEIGLAISVRCLRDASGGGGSTATLPTVTTNTISSITSSSATCGGNITATGGANVTARGVCWSTSPNPTVSSIHTTDGSGAGTFTSNITGLVANTMYYVRAYATNSAGTSYGEQRSFTTSAPPFTCGTSTVTDHEGNIYNTVQIGDQCWTKENLRTTTSPSTGTYLIPAAGTGYTYTGKQAFWYNNDSTTYAPMNYGLLYNWNAAVDTFNTSYGETSVSTDYNSAVSVTFTGHRRGICPVGWHLPSDAEWNTMEANVIGSDWQSTYETSFGYRGSYAGKFSSGDNWATSTTSGAPGDYGNTDRNVSGFSAVPAGSCGGSLFYYASFHSNFWSSTQYASYPNLAYYCNLFYDNAGVGRVYGNEGNGYSVRCLRDASGGGGSTATLPTVTTNTVSSITSSSATCGGNVTATGGASVTARGVCWSTSPNPMVSNSHTNNGSGTGSFTSSITGLTASTTYYVRAYATNSAGTSYGEQRSFTTSGSNALIDTKSCSAAPTVTDYDGNVYPTVQIGNQCWMRENLRTTHYSDGMEIPAGTTPSDNVAYRYAPANIEGNVATYGYLYNWPAVMHGAVSSSANPSGVQGVCPIGWHIPSSWEWEQLMNYVSSNYQCSDYDCIANALSDTVTWNECDASYSQYHNNATGFGVRPAGYYTNSTISVNGAYNYFDSWGWIWCSTQDSGGVAFSYQFICGSCIETRMMKLTGMSVRCLKD